MMGKPENVGNVSVQDAEASCIKTGVRSVGAALPYRAGGADAVPMRLKVDVRSVGAALPYRVARG